MAWFLLLLAGVFEVVWAVGLKQSNGLTKLWPSVVTVVGLAISMVLLGLAIQKLPLGTAYAVWTGIGAVGAVVIGLVYFGESADVMRLVCLGLIVVGILGLKLTSPSDAVVAGPTEAVAPGGEP